MVNNYIIRFNTQEEWDFILNHFKHEKKWVKSDYKSLRDSCKYEYLGVRISNNCIESYSYYNWYEKRETTGKYIFKTCQFFMKNKIHEIW